MFDPNNPWLTKPLPTCEHVVTIAQEALTDWGDRTAFPFPMAGVDSVVEIRQEELFYLQQIVRKLLRDNAEEVDTFLSRALTK